MNPSRTLTLLSILLAGCGGEGTWILSTWGEDYIETGIPAADFADGCSVVFDRFEVVDSDLALLDGDGAVVGEIPGSFVMDMAQPGPVDLGDVTVPATHYDEVSWRIGPTDDEPVSVSVEGTITCGEQSVGFAWDFDTDTTYHCEPEDLTIPAGGEDGTELTVHGDHLFYDSLEDPDAMLRAQAFVDADADADGEVTMAELEAVSVAELGYDVGSRAEVTDLYAFVAYLSRTLGHVDGEGHCQVEL
jgi:hypothetical protein